ncbi:RHS repeat-associated core domain-containing protein [Pseudomonas syringae]|uniref:RHS repeat-associated core domain-containing protein n=1 Tax=Pseudomonas syringae TaxID=317 RepID=UPI003F76967B
MASSNQAVLCRYSYDPLDRLASSSPVGQADLQRFYQQNRLATEIQGALRRTVFQHDDLLLAQQRRVEGVIETTLLATDQQRSVLQLVDKAGAEPIAYSPYGHHPAESGLTSLLGFNGERRDPVTGHYLLGNGYRAYNPVLMRFNSPDSLSPFGEGGLNAYGYVGGDPVGFGDPTGHAPYSMFLKVGLIGRTMKGAKRDSALSIANSRLPTTAIENKPLLNSLSSQGVRPVSDTVGSQTIHSAVDLSIAGPSSATTVNASVSTLALKNSALLSKKDVGRYSSLLSAGLGSDLPNTPHLISLKKSLLKNRILAAKSMVNHYRLKLRAVDGKRIDSYRRALDNYKKHLNRENSEYINFKNNLEGVRRNNS